MPVMEWIAVNESLPETDQKVLVYTDSAFPGEDMFCCEHRGDGQFYIHIDGAMVKGVTHWMPMPQIPYPRLCSTS